MSDLNITAGAGLVPEETNQKSEANLTSKEFRDRLLLAEMKDREINQAVLQPMFRTGPWFWIIVAVLVAIILWGVYAWGYQIYWGFGVAGI
ncbi:MAG: hypothetical protein KAS38_15540, partial [Anaerolineales bacterium]|nr:hypothetical protein [Anaerolineales bacterium]